MNHPTFAEYIVTDSLGKILQHFVSLSHAMKKAKKLANETRKAHYYARIVPMGKARPTRTDVWTTERSNVIPLRRRYVSNVRTR